MIEFGFGDLAQIANATQPDFNGAIVGVLSVYYWEGNEDHPDSGDFAIVATEDEGIVLTVPYGDLQPVPPVGGVGVAP